MKRKIIILSIVIPVLVIAIILLSIFMPSILNENHDRALDDIRSTSITKQYSYKENTEGPYSLISSKIPLYVENHEFLGYLENGSNNGMLEIDFDGTCLQDPEGEYSFYLSYQLYKINSTPVYKATLTTDLLPNYTFVAKNGKEQTYRTKDEKILIDSTIFETCTYKIRDKSDNQTSYVLNYYYLELNEDKIYIHSARSLEFICGDPVKISKLDAMCN